MRKRCLARLGENRRPPLEQKKHAVQTIYDQANKTLDPVFKARPLALTVEIHEIDPETRLLRNGMRERQARPHVAA